ncbi:MAG TPA: CopD family protein [Fibrobacteria bacterium]|nr:CopD family protein [Fibrobacteria bacterium]
MNTYSWALSLHIVSIVSWFAGLFYLGRLFIYHAEALGKPEAERAVLVPQFALMERRLWSAITNPASIATFVTGAWLLYLTGAWRLPWFHAKLVFLILLYAYHGRSGRIRRGLLEGRAPSVKALRFWNEAATVLLFAIVFTAVSKQAFGAGYGLVAVAILTAVGGGIFWAKKKK